MAGDPITAVGNALAGLFGILQPSIDDHYALKFDNAHKDRIHNWDELISLSDSDDRATRLGSFTRGLLDDAGTPVGKFSGVILEIPVEIITALIINTSESIRGDERLARLTFKTAV